jgi:hypothetical protein
MRIAIQILMLLAAMDTVVAKNPKPDKSTVHKRFIDESGWADEPIPAENDPELARILDTYNAPEPWDLP